VESGGILSPTAASSSMRGRVLALNFSPLPRHHRTDFPRRRAIARSATLCVDEALAIAREFETVDASISESVRSTACNGAWLDLSRG